VGDEKRIWTIYCHTCTVTGKKYVGQTTKTMRERWYGHTSSARLCKRRRRTPFQNAIRKYGPEAFLHEVLESVGSERAANEAEARWVAALNTRVPYGYNLDSGGHAAPRHEETGRKIRAARMRLSPEERSALGRAAWTNKSPEERSEIARRAVANRDPEAFREAIRLKNERLGLKPRVAHPITPEAASQRVRDGWANMDPIAKEARLEVMRAGKREAVRRRQFARLVFAIGTEANGPIGYGC
jgi:group I intron endonuclease